MKNYKVKKAVEKKINSKNKVNDKEDDDNLLNNVD